MVGPLCGRVTRNQPKALPSLRVAANKRVRRVARLAGIPDTGASRALRTRFLALQRIREIKSDRLLMSEWWTYRLTSFLLFSPRTYYRLLELYNLAIWPAQLAGAAIGVAIVALLITK